MKKGQKSAKSHTPETAHLENGPKEKKKGAHAPRNTSANDASQVQSIQATCSSNRSTAKLSRSPTDIAPGQKMAAVAVHATTPQDDDDDAEDSSDDSVSAAAPVGMECDSSEDGVWMTNGKRARASAAHVHDADAESSDNERSTVVRSPSPSPVTTTTSSAHNAQSGMKACVANIKHRSRQSVSHFVETNTALTCILLRRRDPPTRVSSRVGQQMAARWLLCWQSKIKKKARKKMKTKLFYKFTSRSSRQRESLARQREA
jgi:hypothetical protein